MRNSGCEVPEYMLQMKKVHKNVVKKLARNIPKRNSISTEPIPDKIKRKKIERRIANAKKSKKTANHGSTPKKPKYAVAGE